MSLFPVNCVVTPQEYSSVVWHYDSFSEWKEPRPYSAQYNHHSALFLQSRLEISNSKMSNGTIKSRVKGVERRQRILSQTSLMRVVFKYENKAVPTASYAGTEAWVVASPRDWSYFASRDRRLRAFRDRRPPQPPAHRFQRAPPTLGLSWALPENSSFQPNRTEFLRG